MPGGDKMSLLLIALRQIIILFLMILIGFICRRSGRLGSGAKADLTSVLINIVLPCVVLDSFLSEEGSEFSSYLPEIVLQLGIIYLITILLTALIIRKKTPDSPSEKISIIYSNAGFLGIPLLDALYGPLGRFCAVMAMIAFNVFFWSYGAMLMAGEDGERAGLKDTMKKILTPPLIAVIFSLLLSAFSLRLPSIIMEPVASIAAMNSPFAMIVTGVTLADSDLSRLFSKRVILDSIHKNVTVPAVLAVIFLLLGFTDDIGISMLTTAACPTAALVPMLAIQYKKDPQLPSGIFAFSTILSVLTLPAYIYLIHGLAGV